MIKLLLILILLFTIYIYIGISVSYQKVANLNGNGASLSIPNTLSDFTITFWLKTTDAGTHGRDIQFYEGKSIINGEVPWTVNDFGITLYDGKIAFGIGNPDITIFTPTTINDGTWHHFAAMKSTNTINIWQDGTKVVESTSAPTAVRNSVTQLQIGNIVGMLSDCRIYNNASTNYITESMTSSTSYQTNLIRWLKLNGNLLDSSNNAVSATSTTVSYYVICLAGTWTVDPFTTCTAAACSGNYHHYKNMIIII